MKIFFQKEGSAEQSNIDFELERAYLLFLLFGHLKRIAFLSVIWLPQSKLSAIIKGTVTVTQC